LNKSQRQFFKKRRKAAKKKALKDEADAATAAAAGAGASAAVDADDAAAATAAPVSSTASNASKAGTAIPSPADQPNGGGGSAGGKDAADIDEDSLCPHIQERFDPAWCSKHADLLGKVSLIAAMHPDEATEEIVDTAVQMRKPFAIVPCCVFPKLGGRMSYANWVRTRACDVEFLESHASKHPSIQSALPTLTPDPKTQILSQTSFLTQTARLSF